MTTLGKWKDSARYRPLSHVEWWISHSSPPTPPFFPALVILKL